MSDKYKYPSEFKINIDNRLHLDATKQPQTEQDVPFDADQSAIDQIAAIGTKRGLGIPPYNDCDKLQDWGSIDKYDQNYNEDFPKYHQNIENRILNEGIEDSPTSGNNLSDRQKKDKDRRRGWSNHLLTSRVKDDEADSEEEDDKINRLQYSDKKNKKQNNNSCSNSYINSSKSKAKEITDFVVVGNNQNKSRNSNNSKSIIKKNTDRLHQEKDTIQYTSPNPYQSNTGRLYQEKDDIQYTSPNPYMSTGPYLSTDRQNQEKGHTQYTSPNPYGLKCRTKPPQNFLKTFNGVAGAQNLMQQNRMLFQQLLGNAGDDQDDYEDFRDRERLPRDYLDKSKTPPPDIMFNARRTTVAEHEFLKSGNSNEMNNLLGDINKSDNNLMNVRKESDSRKLKKIISDKNTIKHLTTKSRFKNEKPDDYEQNRSRSGIIRRQVNSLKVKDSARGSYRPSPSESRNCMGLDGIKGSSLNLPLRGGLNITNAIRESKKTEQSKTVYFNVMLIGEANLGKSKFLSQFLSEVFGKDDIVKKDTKKITEYITERNENGLRYVLNQIDSPGYNNSNRPIKDWYEEISSFLSKKMQVYKDLKKLSAHDKALQSRNLVDCRVHVCLFFFNGMRLQINDVIYMKKLQKIVNIIPIYSCDDPDVDLEEILALKYSLYKESLDYQLRWVDIVQNLDIENICHDKKLEFWEPVPPFYFYNSYNQIDNDEVDLMNDFRLLSILLMGYQTMPLISLTENQWYVTMEKLKRKKKKLQNLDKEKTQGVGVGVFMGVGMLGAIMAVKNKLF